MTAKFYFAKISNTETQTFDNSLEHFHSAKIGGTIRENIQNSIDAKLVDNNEPVKVLINVTKISKAEIPGIEEIEGHIQSLVGGNSYTRETIEHMNRALLTTMVPIITFEDTNTKGLSGVENLEDETTYNIFAYKKGVHFEEENNEYEVIRGGSHGVGKIANNAASDVHLMYFANCDEQGNKHLGGTIQLIEHKMEKDSYRSTGYFSGFNSNNQYVPYKNENFNSVFDKDTRGLKIIIPFLREGYTEINEIVRSVCDNFFLSLLTNKLEVLVSDDEQCIEINHESVQNISQDSKYYSENLNNIEEIKKVFTPLYIETYLNKKPIKLVVKSDADTYSFDLYFMYNEEIKTGRIGIVRSIGMKIVDYKVKNYIRRPFNAVLIGGPKEDQYLKTLENESHTELSSNSLRDRTAKKKANKFISSLNKEIGQIIDQEWEKLNPSDGKINTDDLLYEKDVTFKTKLESMSEKVELTSGKLLRKKKIKEKRGKPINKNKPDENEKKNSKNRKPKKWEPSNKEKQIKEVIIAPNEVVNRIVFSDNEIIKFDLNTIREASTFTKVNINLRVVNGDGREYEFDLESAYSDIKNIMDSSICKFDSFTIYGVQVVNGIINLRLIKKNNRSNSLKFIYRLEVL